MVVEAVKTLNSGATNRLAIPARALGDIFTRFSTFHFVTSASHTDDLTPAITDYSESHINPLILGVL